MPLNQEELKRNLMKAMRADNNMEALGQLYEDKLKNIFKKAGQSDWADDGIEVPKQTESNNGKDKTHNDKSKEENGKDKKEGDKEEGDKESEDKDQSTNDKSKEEDGKDKKEGDKEEGDKESENKNQTAEKDQKDKQKPEEAAPYGKEEAPADKENNKQKDLSFGQKKMMNLYQNQLKRLERLQKNKSKEKSQKEKNLQKKLDKVKQGTLKAKKIQNKILMETVGQLYIEGIATVFLIPVVWLAMTVHTFIADWCNFNLLANDMPIPKFTLKYKLIYFSLTLLITSVVLILLFGFWYITELNWIEKIEVLL